MKNYYYYFLFRLYWVFRDFSKEGHKMALFSTSLASTFFLYFTIDIIMGLVYFFKASASIDLGENYAFWILSFMFILWVINYYLFVKPRVFLRQNFKKDKTGGILIIVFLSSLGFLMIIGGNKNREKISKQREIERIEKLSNYE
ncbi:hypothetical protein [Flavobacterium hercynium]|uniref:Uncharacterized protein n=1 Tax=Flavobacterium hercynium TaxID=387094 RepID=A0A226H161_9FLAO|nr:hypothetical protein [Flavobacterium hercynium]OXA87406.1 hypothetical protein B0A66_16585 [Flavobacterium hercynium]SMP27416.1 hypothetical protein SAMN06265346_110111 [Flavobacterium hercynium]